jgi:hypothetical protein
MDISSKLTTNIIEKLEFELLHKMCLKIRPDLKANFTKCAFLV